MEKHQQKINMGTTQRYWTRWYQVFHSVWYCRRHCATKKSIIKERSSSASRIRLSPKSSGPHFDYRKDEEGQSTTAARHIINPIIRRLVQHPNRSIWNFRIAFKTLLRNLNVGEEIHDANTGHSSPSASKKNYGGMGMPMKFNTIAKIDLSFLRKINIKIP